VTIDSASSKAPGAEPDRGARSFGPGTVSRDALVSLVYAAAVRLGTVGLSIAAARRLGTAGAGSLGVALQVVALASLAATCNLPQGLTQLLSRTTDSGARARLLRDSALLVGVLAVLTGLALTLAAARLAQEAYGDPSLTPVLMACGPLTVAGAAYLWVEGAFQGLRRFTSLARWGTGIALADLLTGVVASVWGVVAMLSARTILRFAAVGVALARGLGPLPTTGPIGTPAVRESGVFRTARSLFGFAAPTLAAGAVLLLGNTLLRLQLVRSHDIAAAGHLQAADSIAQAVTLVPLAAAAAFMPAVAASSGLHDRELAAPLQRAMKQVTGYNLALSLAAIGLAPWVMENIFGRDFGPSRPVFVLLVCAYTAVGPSALFGAWLMGRGRPWTILVVNSLWAATMLLLFQFGLGQLGAVGAALASAIAYWLALACYALVVAPFHELPGSSHLPAILVTVFALSLGAALQLIPGVPLAAAVAGNLILAGLVFARWGVPSLAASPLLARRAR